MQKVVLAMVSARRQMKMYLDMARRGIEDFESSGRTTCVECIFFSQTFLRFRARKSLPFVSEIGRTYEWLRRDMRVYTGLSFRTPPPITSFDFSSTSRITRDLREDMASRSL